MKTKNGISPCDHKMIHLLMEPPRIRACFICKKYWPKEHPKLSQEEIVAVVDFAIFVSEEAERKGKRNVYKPKPNIERDVDLL